MLTFTERMFNRLKPAQITPVLKAFDGHTAGGKPKYKVVAKGEAGSKPVQADTAEAVKKFISQPSVSLSKGKKNAILSDGYYAEDRIGEYSKADLSADVEATYKDAKAEATGRDAQIDAALDAPKNGQKVK